VQEKHNEQIFFSRNMISVSISCKDAAILRYSSLDLGWKKPVSYLVQLTYSNYIWLIQS